MRKTPAKRKVTCPFNAQRKEIERIMGPWKDDLGLHNWKVLVQLSERNCREGYAADIAPRHEYHEALLTVYPLFWKQPKEEKEETLVHELIHAIISPISSGYEDMIEGKFVSRESFTKLNEFTTSHLTTIMMRLKHKE